MEPRSAAVEHVAAPVEPVLAPVDKGSSPWRLQRPCLSPGGLAFSPSGATTLPHINYAWQKGRPIAQLDLVVDFSQVVCLADSRVRFVLLPILQVGRNAQQFLRLLQKFIVRLAMGIFSLIFFLLIT